MVNRALFQLLLIRWNNVSTICISITSAAMALHNCCRMAPQKEREAGVCFGRWQQWWSQRELAAGQGHHRLRGDHGRASRRQLQFGVDLERGHVCPEIVKWSGAAAVDNGTRVSGKLAPDERAAPVAPLWETDAANDAPRRWEVNIEERVQHSNTYLQQMHEMITDKFAGDYVGPRMDKLVHDDVPPFPHMSHVTARDQLAVDMAPVESAVSRVTASVLETPWETVVRGSG